MQSKVLVCGDFHVPYHDPAAVSALLKFARAFKPSHLVVHGDLLDFEALSRFLKDPRKVADPQEEIDAGRDILAKLRDAVGAKCKLIFGIGNHEFRLTSLLMKQAPALLPLKSLDLHELLKLDGWRVVPHEQYVQVVPGLIVLHGISYGPTTNAKNIARFGGFNVAQGHSHRLSQRFVRSLHGIHSAAETGCLCDLSPHYCQQPDWQQGFATYTNEQLRLHLIEKGKVQ